MDLTGIDLSDAQFEREVPFAALAYLREHAPVWWWDAAACWVVTPHALVEQMNRNFEVYSSAGGIVPPGSTINPAVLLAMDPPVHTEYRRMVSRSFMPRSIAAIEGQARAIAEEAVAGFVARDGGDFVIDVATAIPYRVMAYLTGVPREAEPLVMRWGNAISPNSDPEYRPTPTAVEDAYSGLGEFLGAQFAERRRNPGEDLFSQLLSARLDGSPLSEEDLRGFGVNYLLGGTETTRNLLAQGMLALLEHPDQLRRFEAEEVPTTALVDELLRWVTPVMHHSRWPTEDQQVAGQTIRAGDRVTLWMVSANHDEAAFTDAGVFDVGRQPNPHVALGGGGPHYCLGSHLARLEAVVTFETLRPFLAKLRVAGTPERVRSNFINGLKHLPLALNAT